MENGLIYDTKIEEDFNKLSIEHKHVLTLIKNKSKVLEVGCHTGYFSYWLKKKECTVFGADIHAPAIEKASIYLNASFIGDVESELFFEDIKNQSFDTIVIMHVLEHLINPEVFLSKLSESLVKGGNIVIAMPNISCWNSRLNLFKGNFNYTEIGIMDKTHLRFFNYITTRELIKNSGYQIIDFKGIGKSTFSIVPHWRLLWRLNNISSKIFQFLFRNNPNILYHVMVFNIEKTR